MFIKRKTMSELEEKFHHAKELMSKYSSIPYSSFYDGAERRYENLKWILERASYYRSQGMSSDSAADLAYCDHLAKIDSEAISGMQ